MSAPAPQPTPYPEVNTTLHALRHALVGVLGGNLAGLYIHGSLAAGDFSPQRSDIDFVAATAGALSRAQFEALQAMHDSLAKDETLKWAARLEGYYIPRQALRRYDPRQAEFPALHVGGIFGMDRLGVDWVLQSHVLREHGITMSGPPPKMMVDPLTPDELRQAARATLQEWWAPMLGDPCRLHSRAYQAYAALTMCRVVHTLSHGEVITKTAAAHQAQVLWGARESELIERALAWPEEPQPDRLEETLDLIRYTLEFSLKAEIGEQKNGG